MKAFNFPNDNPSIPMDKFEDHYVLAFDLTSMQSATDKCQCPELVGKPLRLELNFTPLLEHATELILLRKGMSLDVVEKFGVVRKNI